MEDLTKIREIPIARILGLPPTRRRIQVRCPFHNEKDASLSIYPDNSFHCFGCNKHGRGAIDFVVALGYSVGDAIEELKGYL